MTERAGEAIGLHLPQGMTIGGRSVTTDRTTEVIDPATEELVATAPAGSSVHVDEAMAAAAAAQRSWATTPDAERRRVMEAAADAVAPHTGELGALLSAEQGKPVAHAVAEAEMVVGSLRYYAGLDLDPEPLQDDDGARVVVERIPIGVVAAIAPWNYPLLMAVWKVAPALRAGNAVVLKPSPFTPLATLRLGEILAPVLPPGLVNVVSGDGDVGALMVEHDVPGKVSFTGSTRTGRLVAAAAARDLKRLTLELGGNDPAIVLDDVDLAGVAKRLFWSAFTNNGHACVAVKRVYAPRSRYDEVVEALAACADAARVGPGTEPRVQLGPVSNRPQLDRVEGLVAEAVASGGRIAAGGGRRGERGFFHDPTIVAGPDERSALVAEEQFGPVLPVLAYDDVDDAVARANDTRYGLGASVWSSDVERGEAVAARLQAGTVWVNEHGKQRPDQPIGGLRWSGLGVENGPRGLDAYADLRVSYVSRR
jgi:acyl-CoA reductase-like NAD-dependent aldehyde dehydrogenase